MKKIVFLLTFFITITSFALADELRTLKIKILSYLAHNLIGNNTITIYLADNSFLQNTPKGKVAGLKFAEDCNSAQLIVTGSLKNLSKQCLKKPIFATNYALYKNHNVVGALFWQKGRPVLILKKKALIRKHLRVCSKLEKYIQ